MKDGTWVKAPNQSLIGVGRELLADFLSKTNAVGVREKEPILQNSARV